MEERTKLYNSDEFGKLVEQKCNFTGGIYSVAKVKVASLADARRVIAVAADLPNKHKFFPEIDPSASMTLRPEGDGFGLVYRFLYRGGGEQKLADDLDYYREFSSIDEFRGCLLYSKLPVDSSTVKFSIKQLSEGTYVERIAHVKPSLALPSFVTQSKADEVNLRSLQKMVSRALTL